MAGSKTDFGENLTLTTLLKIGTGNVYLGLHSVASTESTPGTEIAGNGYVRQLITFNAASLGSTSNSAQVNFPNAVPAGYSVNGWAIYDNVAGGNEVYYDSYGAPIAVGIGSNFKVNAGDCVITEG